MADLTRGGVNDLIAKFAVENAEYKQALMADPKKVVAMQLGQDVPESLTIRVVEDSAELMHMVLPFEAAEGDELSDADLEMVAGGKGGGDYTCNDIKGIGTHVVIETSLI
jgi:Nitrile hydratase, alpha chain